MDEALEWGFEFTKRSSNTWERLNEKDYSLLRRFQNLIFPQKVTFNGENFGTTNLSLLYWLNQQSVAEKSELVPYIERNWNQLVSELNQWRILGKEIAAVI